MTHFHANFICKFKDQEDELWFSDSRYSFVFFTKEEAEEWLKKDGMEIKNRFLENHGERVEWCKYILEEE